MTNILNHKRLRRTKRNDISISNSDEDDYYLKQKDSIIEEKDEIILFFRNNINRRFLLCI